MKTAPCVAGLQGGGEALSDVGDLAVVVVRGEALFLGCGWTFGDRLELSENGAASHPLDPTARSIVKMSWPFLEAGPVISDVAISG